VLVSFAIPASAPALAAHPGAAISSGRLTATPGPVASFVASAKSEAIDLPNGTRAYLPAGIGKNGPAPLLLLLHGTGGDGGGLLKAFRGEADQRGFVIVAPTARGANWDAVDTFVDAYEARTPAGRAMWPVPIFGPDADRIDAALAALFARVPIDPKRIGILGFSHGASYALMLGTANPQLFGSIAALSPGLLVLREDVAGGQNIFVAHGTKDDTLPYWRTEKAFVPRLKELGYHVTFRPFVGGHTLDPEATDEAVRFFLAAPSAICPGCATPANPLP
jgi:phospholipase/carboxylesterase